MRVCREWDGVRVRKDASCVPRPRKKKKLEAHPPPLIFRFVSRGYQFRRRNYIGTSTASVSVTPKVEPHQLAWMMGSEVTRHEMRFMSGSAFICCPSLSRQHARTHIDYTEILHDVCACFPRSSSLHSYVKQSFCGSRLLPHPDNV